MFRFIHQIPELFYLLWIIHRFPHLVTTIPFTFNIHRKKIVAEQLGEWDDVEVYLSKIRVRFVVIDVVFDFDTHRHCNLVLMDRFTKQYTHIEPFNANESWHQMDDYVEALVSNEEEQSMIIKMIRKFFPTKGWSLEFTSGATQSCQFYIERTRGENSRSYCVPLAFWLVEQLIEFRDEYPESNPEAIIRVAVLGKAHVPEFTTPREFRLYRRHMLRMDLPDFWETTLLPFIYNVMVTFRNRIKPRGTFSSLKRSEGNHGWVLDGSDEEEWYAVADELCKRL